MKKEFYYLIVLFLPSVLFSGDYSQISPINFDLVGVVAKGDQIVAYGTQGAIYHSSNNGQAWNVMKPFDTGNIVNFFIEDNRLVAFLQTGEVSQSVNSGLSWEVTNPIDDSVSYVVKGNGNYFVRAKNSIIKLSSNFEKLNSYPYSYIFGFDISYHYLPKNRRYMSFFDNKLYVIDNSRSTIMVLNDSLEKISSVNIGERFYQNSTCQLSQLMCDSNSLILQIGVIGLDSVYFGRLTPGLDKLSIIINNSDKEYLKQLFKEYSPFVFELAYYNGHLYALNRFRDANSYGPFYNVFELYSMDSVNYLGALNTSIGNGAEVPKFAITDFVVENNRITAVGKGSFLVTKDLATEITERVSNMYRFGSSPNINQISNKGFLVQTGQGIFRSNDTTKTFQEVAGDTAIFNSYLNLERRFSYFDDEEKKLYYFAYSTLLKDSGSVYISNDYGDHFSEKHLDNINFRNLSNNYSFMKVKDKYIIIEYQNKPYVYYYFDKDFNFVKSEIDSNYLYNYLYLEDDLNFTALVTSSINGDNNKYLQSTTDGGVSWKIEKTFGSSSDTLWFNDSTQFAITVTSNLRTIKEIEYNEKSYLLFVTYIPTDSIYRLEVLDLATKKLSILLEQKQQNYPNTLIEQIGDGFIVCKGDTIFYTNDILNRNKWNGVKLPNNGSLYSKIMVSGNYYITSYSDSSHPYGLYRIKISGLMKTGGIENSTEILPYFYSSPPFPQPTSSLVSTKIYLDRAGKLTSKDTKVFNINGVQVEAGENINISSNTWPTVLTWDASNQVPGIYFIVVELEGQSKAIKVVKE